MPILTMEEEDKRFETKEEREETRVFRNQDDMKTSTLFNKETKLDTIIKHIRGAKWEVDYFLQIRDINDEVQELDVNLAPTIQKYNRINKLLITVQTPIDQGEIKDITGEGIINAGFIPNVNDIILTTLLGGREALLMVTEVNTRSYNLHKAYYISYKLFMFLDSDKGSVYYNDLINKTMKEYVYDKEHLLDYSAPVILSQDYKTKIELKHHIPDLIELYFSKFIYYEKYLHYLPTKASIYVDTLLTDFLFKITSTDDHPDMVKVNRITPDLHKELPYTIWTAIIKRDIKILKRCERKIGFKYNPFGLKDALNHHINILGVNFIARKLLKDESFEEVHVIENELKDFPKDYQEPITGERMYVFSQAFYEQDRTKIGDLENLVLDYLEGKILSSEKLNKLIEECVYWNTRDQYYLIPILLVLIKDAMSNTFKSL